MATMAALGLGAQFGVLLPFSRKHESEADEIGQELMAKAGFNPQGAIELWQNMKKAGGGGGPQWMSTHPSHKTRIRDLQKGLNKNRIHYQNAKANGRIPNCGRL